MSTTPPPESSEQRFQFSLLDMLLLMGGLCVVLAVGVAWGPLGGYLALSGCLLLVFSLHPRLRRYAGKVLFTWFAASMLVLLLLPARGGAREAARRNGCLNYTRQICLALDNYEQDYGSYPPAYTTDDAGTRLHSWRTLLLPYLEEEALYNSMNLSLPWNHPMNQQAISQHPHCYSCPSYGGPLGTTTYVAVTGPETMWPGAGSRKKGEVTDGLTSTVLILETRRGDIHWAEPRDLTLDEVLTAFDAGDKTGFGSMHAGPVAMVGLANGKVLPVVPAEINRETLRAMLTIAGGEVYDQDALEEPPTSAPPIPDPEDAP